ATIAMRVKERPLRFCRGSVMTSARFSHRQVEAHQEKPERDQPQDYRQADIGFGFVVCFLHGLSPVAPAH
ncbi:MAG: hypothetical protein WBN00_03235, partial [Sedimenticolaceae bacterium]